MKQAFYPLRKQYIELAWQQENTFIQAFISVPGCQNCMYKRGIMTYEIAVAELGIFKSVTV